MTAVERPDWILDYVVWAVGGRRKSPRPPGVPRAIPSRYLWIPAFVLWRLSGGRPAQRPKAVPRDLRGYPWLWDLVIETRKAIERPALRTPPPPVESVFRGLGWLTAWNPRAALELPGSWVGVRETCTPQIADELRSSGKRVVLWEAISPTEGRFELYGQAAIDRLGALGWMPQDEHDVDRTAAMRALARGISVETVFCTNNHAGHGGRRVAVEAYENANPRATPGAVTFDARNMGGEVVVVVPGIYDATEEQRGQGRLIHLDAFVRAFQDLSPRPIGLAPYLAEHAIDPSLGHAAGIELAAELVGP